MITTTVLKISKSIIFAPNMHLLNSTREIKSKTSAGFEPATHRLLASTGLRGKLPNIGLVQIKSNFHC